MMITALMENMKTCTISGLNETGGIG